MPTLRCSYNQNAPKPTTSSASPALSTHQDAGSPEKRRRDGAHDTHRTPGHAAGERQTPMHGSDEAEHYRPVGNRDPLRQLALAG